MARNWNTLSAAYQKRLTNAGISKTDYEAGAVLTKARGHANTPEHPRDIEKYPGKYRKYENSRHNLTRQVIARKKAVFGNTPRFSDLHSRDYVLNGVPHLAGFEQRPPSLAEMKAFLKMSDNQMYAAASEAARGRELKMSALWYH